MTVWQDLALAIVLLGMVAWLIFWRGRRYRVSSPPYPPSFPSVLFDVEYAIRFARERQRECSLLPRKDLRFLLLWCAEYVRQNATPLNGTSGYNGWFAPPNIVDIVEHLQEKARAQGLTVQPRCLLDVANLYDDCVRSSGKNQ